MPINPMMKNPRSIQDAFDADISAFSMYRFDDGSILYSEENIYKNISKVQVRITLCEVTITPKLKLIEHARKRLLS